MTSSINIPDFVPNLRHGKGSNPADGGCLVQVTGWLADGKSWTDHTPCVHEALRLKAIHLNDATRDDYRQQLMKFAPRLIGTSRSTDEDRDFAVHIANWAAYRAAELSHGEHSNQGSFVSLAEEIARFSDCSSTAFLGGYRDSGFWNAYKAIDFLSALEAWEYRDRITNEELTGDLQSRIDSFEAVLDEFDRYTGREVSGRTVTEQQWRNLSNVMTGANA